MNANGNETSAALEMAEAQNGTTQLYAPFPYFGGKRKVVKEVWRRFGDAPNYIEPFFGSGATLLGRPGLSPSAPPIETVNDKNGFLANFWRSVKLAPEEVADHCDWPANEVELEARHRWLVSQPDKDTFLQRMKEEPDYYDPKRAAYWAWGLACWLGGSDWCVGEWHPETRTGRHVHRKKPNFGRGLHSRLKSLDDWMAALAARLRHVNVCCGDWTRICGPANIEGRLTAVFLDPPYADTADRTNGLYAEDSLSVAHEVRNWAVEHGDDPKMRVALCGYEGEHEMPASWQVFDWSTAGGYGNQGEGRGRSNAKRERIWFSPHCLPRNPQADKLF